MLLSRGETLIRANRRRLTCEPCPRIPDCCRRGRNAWRAETPLDNFITADGFTGQLLAGLRAANSTETRLEHVFATAGYGNRQTCCHGCAVGAAVMQSAARRRVPDTARKKAGSTFGHRRC